MNEPIIDDCEENLFRGIVDDFDDDFDEDCDEAEATEEAIPPEERIVVEVGPANRRTRERQVCLRDSHTGRFYESVFRLPPRNSESRRLLKRNGNDSLDEFLLNAAEFLCEDSLLWCAREIFDRAEAADKVTLQSIRNRPLTPQDIGELRLDARPDALVNGLLDADQLAMLLGVSKAGKTTNAVEMLVALASGTPAFGFFDVPKRRRVALFSGEVGMYRLCEMVELAAASRKLSTQSLSGFLHLCDDVPALTDPADMAQLVRHARVNHWDAVAIDPVFVAMPGLNHGSIFEVAALLFRFAREFVGIGCTPILLHHANKTRSIGAPSLSDAAWAGFDTAVRQWIGLGRREPFAVGSGHHAWEISVGSSLGRSSRWWIDFDERTWQSTVTEANAQPKLTGGPAGIDRDREKVLTIVRSSPTGETKNAIKTAGNFRSDRLEPAIKSLLASGEICECKVKKPNREKSYAGFRVSGTGNATGNPG